MPNLLNSTFSSDDTLSDDRLHRLAHELARNLLPTDEVLKNFGISAELFSDVIQPNEIFQRYYTESFALWHGTQNLPERVKTKAAMMLEEWLPEASRLMHDPQANLPPKVQLAIFLGELSGLKTQAGAAAANQGASVNNKVHVTINLGHGRQVIIEKKLDSNTTIEGEAVDITPKVQQAVPTTPVYMSEPTTPVYMSEPTPPPTPSKQDLSDTPVSVNIGRARPRPPSVRMQPTDLPPVKPRTETPVFQQPVEEHRKPEGEMYSVGGRFASKPASSNE